jgi:hypothetical protein
MTSMSSSVNTCADCADLLCIYAIPLNGSCDLFVNMYINCRRPLAKLSFIVYNYPYPDQLPDNYPDPYQDPDPYPDPYPFVIILLLGALLG